MSTLEHSSRRRYRRGTAALAGAALTTLLLAACAAPAPTGSSSDPSEVTPGGTLVIGATGYPTCIDKNLRPQWPLPFDGLYDKLVAQDVATGEIVPWLATDWTISPDGLQYTFTIRDGVTFSNGETLDASVVAQNIQKQSELYAEGAAVADGVEAFDQFAGVSAPDANTVVVDFAKPVASFLQGLTLDSFGIIAPESLALTPEERCSTGVITSGPFVIDKLVPNEQVVLTKRVDYDWGSALNSHDGAAYLDEIDIKIIPEESVRLSSLISGDVDLIDEVSNDNSSTVESSGKLVERGLSAGVVRSLNLNTSNPILADTSVRQALVKGTNTKEIVDSFLSADDLPATSALAVSTPGYIDTSDALAFDPDAANDLLDGAGWTLGADGYRSKSGQKLTLELLTNDTSKNAVDEQLQSQLKDIGVDLQIVVKTAAEVSADLDSGDWQIYKFQAGRADGSALATLDPVTSYYRGNGPKPELTDLLNKQITTVDPTERDDLLAQIQTLVADEAYIVPLHEVSQTYGVDPTVHGLTLLLDPYRVNFFDTWKEN